MPLALPALLRRALRSSDTVACDSMLRSASLPADVQHVLLADTKRLAGQFPEANRHLSQIRPRALDGALRVFSERVRGELLGVAGLVTEAIDVLGRVLVDGEACSEHEQVALASLSRFTLLTSHRGLAESQLGLEQAKKAVLRCGDSQLLAALHARVGQAYAQRSLPSVAIAELLSALDLLRPEPNAHIEAFAMLALSGAEYLLSRNKEAARWARSSQRIAERNGLDALEFAATANLAFLTCRRGRTKRARLLAEKCLTKLPTPTLARGALLDTLATVAMHDGDLTTASEAIAEIDSIIGTLQGTNLLLVDSAPVRARFAKVGNRLTDGQEILSSGMRAAEERGDTLGWAKLALLRAELGWFLHHPHAADMDLLAVIERVHVPNAELLALLARVRAARAKHYGDTRRFSTEMARSERIFVGSGDLLHARQTSAMRASGLPAPSRSAVPKSRTPRRSQYELPESLSVVCGLLSQPHLAGAEAVRLFKRLKVVSSAVVRTGQEAATEGEKSLALGVLGSDAIVLYVTPLPDTSSREVVAHVLGILRHLVAASRAQTESKKTTLSWDLDAAPDGRHGLYISAQMKQLFSAIKRVASGNASVLVTGETGTGKEVVARDIHSMSPRSHSRFVAFNVSAVPRDMLEGQLFGHRKGAFTGAVEDVKGLIREAEGGTLFIDEIGELGLDLQPKLLRFLESGEIQPIGQPPFKVDVRVIVATNASLDDLVRQGRFREDLFYRLNVVALTIPPLRERPEEIPTLLNHFLTIHSEQAGKLIPHVTTQAMERLCTYTWPGNVRQLSNELRRLVALGENDDEIEVRHLSRTISQTPVQSAPCRVEQAGIQIRLDRTLQEMYDDIERAAIARAMEQTLNNQTEAARLLGITRKGLYLKRQRLGLIDALPQ